ncbi:hypothetical protein [Methylomonas albis]|nr:hypothetical protein [Methylomonas albis]
MCWIAFFQARKGYLGDQVAVLIETNQAAITKVIIAELLHGVKQEKGIQRL